MTTTGKIGLFVGGFVTAKVLDGCAYLYFNRKAKKELKVEKKAENSQKSIQAKVEDNQKTQKATNGASNVKTTAPKPSVDKPAVNSTDTEAKAS